MKYLLCSLMSLLPGIASAHVLPRLDGNYQMKLTIGEHLFLDQMKLKGQQSPLHLYRFNGNIVGTITVPGIFSSPLNGTAQCSRKTSSCNLQFEILAVEGGRSYKVIYKAQMAPENFKKALHGETPVLTGSAYLESGELLGNFIATRQ
ncbi:hypothetical protein [Bdellovibrio sp. HCB-162]|uniref:hypothetical protein n=1 Tax=Bdellovibrio sp. HCB-162 TaxID=3394234 RepID=UPI0039BC3C26